MSDKDKKIITGVLNDLKLTKFCTIYILCLNSTPKMLTVQIFINIYPAFLHISTMQGQGARGFISGHLERVGRWSLFNEAGFVLMHF